MFDFENLSDAEDEPEARAPGQSEDGAGATPDQRQGPSPLPPLSPAARRLFGLAGEKVPIEEVVIPAGAVLRVATISDVHVDTPLNRKWFERHMPKKSASFFNVLILPGDVSDDFNRLRETLQMLTSAFDLVCYTPGNHDIWVVRKDSPPDSLAKFREVLRICQECGVRTRPLRLMSSPKDPGTDVMLVPLLSFYTSDWDHEPDLPWTPEKQKTMEAWTDFKAIRWPQELVEEVRRRSGGRELAFGPGGTSAALSEVFSAVNELWLQEIVELTSSRGSHEGPPPAVISYSHYLPRQELFPEKRFLVDAMLHKVSGSVALEGQIRRLRPCAHIFGHTHLTVDLELEGQRYLQWALGTPSEQRAMTRAVGDTGMLVIYDAGGKEPHLAPVQETFWGRFFAKGLRRPEETCPASFVRGLFGRLYPDVKLPLDDNYFFEKTPHPGPPIESYEGLYEQRWRL